MFFHEKQTVSITYHIHTHNNTEVKNSELSQKSNLDLVLFNFSKNHNVRNPSYDRDWKEGGYSSERIAVRNKCAREIFILKCAGLY